MNNYYETEDKPTCGLGNHATTGGWSGNGRNMNGSCVKCLHYPDQEMKRVVASIPKGTGKHRKDA